MAEFEGRLDTGGQPTVPQDGESLTTTLGRGGIRLPHVDREVVLQHGADPYITELWRANGVKPQPFPIEGSSIRELVVPGNADQPTSIIRTVDHPVQVTDGQDPWSPHDSYSEYTRVETTQVLQIPSQVEHPEPPNEILRIDITDSGKNYTSYSGRPHNHSNVDTEVQQESKVVWNDDFRESFYGSKANALFATVELFNHFAADGETVEPLIPMTPAEQDEFSESVWERRHAGEQDQPTRSIEPQGRPPKGTTQGEVRTYWDNLAALQGQIDQATDPAEKSLLEKTANTLVYSFDTRPLDKIIEGHRRLEEMRRSSSTRGGAVYILPSNSPSEG